MFSLSYSPNILTRSISSVVSFVQCFNFSILNMFFVSFQLLYFVASFVWKSARKLISGDAHPDYEVAKTSSFKAVSGCKNGRVYFDPPVYVQRYLVVSDFIKEYASQSSELIKVVDFGCAEISFFEYIKRFEGITKILEIDIDEELLEKNTFRTKPISYNFIVPRKSPFSVDVIAGSIAQCDPCLLNTDVFVSIELIEHLYPQELDAVPWTVFGYTQPKVAIFTTPNVEFNILFDLKTPFRHDDHKFEWTRQQFHDWGENIVLRYPNYRVRFCGIGPGEEGTECLGCASQMAVFTLVEDAYSNPGSVVHEEKPSEYKLIKSYDYPYEEDLRTDDEKIRDEVTHHRIRLAHLEPYASQSVIKIELRKFLPYLSDWCKSVAHLKEVLESFGTTLGTNEDGDDCVIGMEDEISSDEDDSVDDCTDEYNYAETECLAGNSGNETEEDWGTVQVDYNSLPSNVNNQVSMSTNFESWEVSDSKNSVSVQVSDNFNVDGLVCQEYTRKESSDKGPITVESNLNNRYVEKNSTDFFDGKKNFNDKSKQHLNTVPEQSGYKKPKESVKSEIKRVEISILNKNYEAETPPVTDYDVSTDSGPVWVISDELRCVKPKRRKHKNIKTKIAQVDKSFSAEEKSVILDYLGSKLPESLHCFASKDSVSKNVCDKGNENENEISKNNSLITNVEFINYLNQNGSKSVTSDEEILPVIDSDKAYNVVNSLVDGNKLAHSPDSSSKLNEYSSKSGAPKTLSKMLVSDVFNAMGLNNGTTVTQLNQISKSGMDTFSESTSNEESQSQTSAGQMVSDIVATNQLGFKVNPNNERENSVPSLLNNKLKKRKSPRKLRKRKNGVACSELVSSNSGNVASSSSSCDLSKENSYQPSLSSESEVDLSKLNLSKVNFERSHSNKSSNNPSQSTVILKNAEVKVFSKRNNLNNSNEQTDSGKGLSSGCNPFLASIMKLCNEEDSADIRSDFENTNKIQSSESLVGDVTSSKLLSSEMSSDGSEQGLDSSYFTEIKGALSLLKDSTQNGYSKNYDERSSGNLNSSYEVWQSPPSRSMASELREDNICFDQIIKTIHAHGALDSSRIEFLS